MDFVRQDELPTDSGLTSQIASTTPTLTELQRRELECVEFFDSPELGHLPTSRRREALRELHRTGTYTHTAEELLVGAKLAWRNHARCVGRAHWRTLKLIDARDAVTASALAEACWEHLRLSTNGGALQSVVTVGPLPREDGQEYRILSPQLIRYAATGSLTAPFWATRGTSI